MAELVYGIKLHLPGEFFTNNTSNSCDGPASCVITLDLRPVAIIATSSLHTAPEQHTCGQ